MRQPGRKAERLEHLGVGRICSLCMIRDRGRSDGVFGTGAFLLRLYGVSKWGTSPEAQLLDMRRRTAHFFCKVSLALFGTPRTYFALCANRCVETDAGTAQNTHIIDRRIHSSLSSCYRHFEEVTRLCQVELSTQRANCVQAIAIQQLLAKPHHRQ